MCGAARRAARAPRSREGGGVSGAAGAHLRRGLLWRLWPADRRTRVVVVLAVVVVALNAVTYVAGRLAPDPVGPAGSSLATVPGGLRGWADLLERRGHPVRRLADAPRDRLPSTEVTVVVAAPRELADADARALARFVERGGRLVAAGPGIDGLARRLVPAAPPRATARPAATPAGPLAPLPEVAGVTRVEGARRGWRPGAALPALGAPGTAPLLVVARPGRGHAALLADAEPLRNRGLGRADAAALALALAGPTGRPVAFLESVHGARPATGLAALPARWRTGLALLGLAALVLLLSRARRLGPPELPGRKLPPPRDDHVRGLAATLARTRDDRGAAAPLVRAAREALGRGPTAAPEDVERAARARGLPDDEAAVVAGRQDDLVLAGRALARLRGPA
jgi:hypothetical protein